MKILILSTFFCLCFSAFVPVSGLEVPEVRKPGPTRTELPRTVGGAVALQSRSHRLVHLLVRAGAAMEISGEAWIQGEPRGVS